MILKFKIVFKIFFAQLALKPVSLHYVFVHPHAVLFKGRHSFETIVAFDGVTFFPVVFFSLNKEVKDNYKNLRIDFQFDSFYITP
jgi:hypothetical protein